MLSFVNRLGQRAGVLTRNGIAAMLLLAFCCGPAPAAEDLPSGAASDAAAARALADGVPDEDTLRRAEDARDVLRRAENVGDVNNLGEWSRSVIDNALKRAGKTASETTAGSKASPAPLPAERHAAGVAAGPGGRANSGEILVFLSLSVPSASWTQWAQDAARAGVPLVLRGAGSGGLRATVKAVGDRLGGIEAGVAVDPRLFRLFGVERVPAVIAVPGGAPPCASRGCADDAPPPFDAVAGNIGLTAALETIASEGDAGREIARQHLERMRGE